MIEGMFVFVMGMVTGTVAASYYFKKSVEKSAPQTKLFDESKYLTPNGKYFTNKAFDDEGGK